MNKNFEDLKKESLVELRIMAKQLGIKSPYKYKKDELIEMIEEKFIPVDTDTSVQKSSETEKIESKDVKSNHIEEKNVQLKDNNLGHDEVRLYSRGQVDSRRLDSNMSEEQGDMEDEDRDGKKPFVVPDMTSENKAEGVLEILPDGFGFLRGSNYLSTENDIYVSPNQIRKFGLKTGDFILGITKPPNPSERFKGLMFIDSVNGDKPFYRKNMVPFEKLVPIYPNEKIVLERDKMSLSTRIMDLFSPIGKGQRGLIVAPPKVGKTMLLKEVANSISKNYPDMTLIVLLIDERPEEVTDMMESIDGEVIYSTFDQAASHHIKVAEMVLNRAQRMVEHGNDVVILLDSITRLARAYNLSINPTGRTLSGGLDPGALYGPKKFFGAARNIRGGGSLTILGTALVDTGSRMDDVVFEEFKGTGNMELNLDRGLAEKRIFPAIDIYKSGTRREDLLLSKDEVEVLYKLRRTFGSESVSVILDKIIEEMKKTDTNAEFIEITKKISFK